MVYRDKTSLIRGIACESVLARMNPDGRRRTQLEVRPVDITITHGRIASHTAVPAVRCARMPLHGRVSQPASFQLAVVTIVTRADQPALMM